MSQPMIFCEVCHTQQPNAWDCATCGHALHPKPALQVEAAPVEALESTALAGALNVAVAPLGELEPTALGEMTGELAIEPILELETTSHPSVGVPAPDQVAEPEPTALAAADAPSPTSAQKVCRFCATPWVPGRSIFCARCGMKLDLPGAAAPTAATSAAAERRACTACGARSQAPKAPCVNCGTLISAD